MGTLTRKDEIELGELTDVYAHSFWGGATLDFRFDNGMDLEVEITKIEDLRDIHKAMSEAIEWWEKERL